jgi:hypothetical protein
MLINYVVIARHGNKDTLLLHKMAYYIIKSTLIPKRYANIYPLISISNSNLVFQQVIHGES